MARPTTKRISQTSKLVVFTHGNAAANAFPFILAEWFAREFGLVLGTRILVLATVYTHTPVRRTSQISGSDVHT